MVEIKIHFDPETQQIRMSAPQDNILVLGLLGFAHILVQQRINSEGEGNGSGRVIPFRGPLPPPPGERQ